MHIPGNEYPLPLDAILRRALQELTPHEDKPIDTEALLNTLIETTDIEVIVNESVGYMTVKLPIYPLYINCFEYVQKETVFNLDFVKSIDTKENTGLGTLSIEVKIEGFKQSYLVTSSSPSVEFRISSKDPGVNSCLFKLPMSNELQTTIMESLGVPNQPIHFLYGGGFKEEKVEEIRRKLVYKKDFLVDILPVLLKQEIYRHVVGSINAAHFNFFAAKFVFDLYGLGFLLEADGFETLTLEEEQRLNDDAFRLAAYEVAAKNGRLQVGGFGLYHTTPFYTVDEFVPDGNFAFTEEQLCNFIHTQLIDRKPIPPIYELDEFGLKKEIEDKEEFIKRLQCERFEDLLDHLAPEMTDIDPKE